MSDSEEYIENVTTIKCQECGEAYNIKRFHLKNACDTCTCKNLQFIVVKINNPVNIDMESMLTVKYNKSEPIIHEIPSKGKRPEQVEKEKATGSRLGFT